MDNLINEFVEVCVEKPANVLSVKFLGFIPYQDFIKVAEHEYKLIRQNKLKKCIIDLRQIPVYDKGMPEYINGTWFPTVVSLGMKSCAFVVPEAVLGQMSMNRAHKDTDDKPEMAVEHFKDIASAMAWLKTH